MTIFQKFASWATLMTAFAVTTLDTQDANAQLSASGKLIKNPVTGATHFNEFGNDRANAETFEKILLADPAQNLGGRGLNAIGHGIIAIGGHGQEKGFAVGSGAIAVAGGIQLADGTVIGPTELASRLLSQKDGNGKWLFNGEAVYLNACDVGRLTGWDSFAQKLAYALDKGLKERGVAVGFTNRIIAPNGLLVSTTSVASFTEPDGNQFSVGEKVTFAVADKVIKDANGKVTGFENMIPILKPNAQGELEMNPEAFTTYFADKEAINGATIRPHKPHDIDRGR